MVEKSDKPTEPQKLDYEPWPQSRKLPRAIKVTIWIAIVVHAMGIIPAIALFIFAFKSDGARGGLDNAISGGVCCIPLGLISLLGFLVFLSKMGDRNN